MCACAALFRSESRNCLSASAAASFCQSLSGPLSRSLAAPLARFLILPPSDAAVQMLSRFPAAASDEETLGQAIPLSSPYPQK